MAGVGGVPDEVLGPSPTPTQSVRTYFSRYQIEKTHQKKEAKTEATEGGNSPPLVPMLTRIAAPSARCRHGAACLVGKFQVLSVLGLWVYSQTVPHKGSASLCVKSAMSAPRTVRHR